MFFFGLAMRGPLFQPQGGDLLTMIIYCGGYIAPIFSGAIYGLTTAFGYAQPDVAGHVHDYGTKFLVAAGLLNILRDGRCLRDCNGEKKTNAQDESHALRSRHPVRAFYPRSFLAW